MALLACGCLAVLDRLKPKPVRTQSRGVDAQVMLGPQASGAWGPFQPKARRRFWHRRFYRLGEPVPSGQCLPSLRPESSANMVQVQARSERAPAGILAKLGLG